MKNVEMFFTEKLPEQDAFTNRASSMLTGSYPFLTLIWLLVVDRLRTASYSGLLYLASCSE